MSTRLSQVRGTQAGMGDSGWGLLQRDILPVDRHKGKVVKGTDRRVVLPRQGKA